jgi:hypothetical protein
MTYGDWRELANWCLWHVFFMVTLVAGPWFFIVCPMARLRWNLWMMLLFTTTAGVYVVGLTSKPYFLPGEFLWPADRQMAAFQAVPPVVLLVQLVRWLIMGRWRETLLAVVAVITFAAITAAFLLKVNPPPPGEYYSRTGWYLLLLPAFYVTGVLYLFLVGESFALRRIWIWCGGRRQAPSRA